MYLAIKGPAGRRPQKARHSQATVSARRSRPARAGWPAWGRREPGAGAQRTRSHGDAERRRATWQEATRGCFGPLPPCGGRGQPVPGPGPRPEPRRTRAHARLRVCRWRDNGRAPAPGTPGSGRSPGLLPSEAPGGGRPMPPGRPPSLQRPDPLRALPRAPGRPELSSGGGRGRACPPGAPGALRASPGSAVSGLFPSEGAVGAEACPAGTPATWTQRPGRGLPPGHSPVSTCPLTSAAGGHRLGWVLGAGPGRSVPSRTPGLQ